MLFMNDFLQQHWERMRCFLQTVSSPDIEIPMTSFDGYVDLPLRLAVLHSLLVDIISPMKQVGINQLNQRQGSCHDIPVFLYSCYQSFFSPVYMYTIVQKFGVTRNVLVFERKAHVFVH
jgi:hypothetical protein